MPNVLVYGTLRAIARVALRWYYRSVDVVGLDRVPTTGPVFLAGNHPNALMDALVVGVVLPRPVRLLAKATLFRNPVLGALMRAAGVIPLQRAHDRAGTPDPARNAAAFQAVASALGEGSTVVIFPEGISHDEPQLAPLRTGLARMALDARDVHGVRDITIVPVGLVFERKDTPRTRVLLQVGVPLPLDAAEGADASVATLTATVEQRLRAVTLNFASAEDAERTLGMAHALAELLTPTRRIEVDRDGLRDVVQLVQRIRRTAERVEGTAAARAFEERFAAFRARLATERLAIADLAIDPGTTPGVWFALREAARALIRGPFGAWGRVNHWVPLRIARAVAMRGVRSRDEPAMRSVVLGAALVLLFYAAQTTAVWRLCGGWWAVAYALTLIPSASQDLRDGDRARRARERARAWFRFRRDPALQRALLAEAQWLRRAAGELERMA
jgi:glycerol-3-phosphate O-acyltransferase / dihydroxyacetone phosphate acyltransferase